jgi:hypothetical protein
MKLLLTALIGLTLSTLALPSEPDLLVRPFQTKNGTKLTCTFFTDGGSAIHATITFPKGDQLDVTLQQLYPNSKRLTLSAAQAQLVHAIAEAEVSYQDYVLTPIDPVTGKAVAFRCVRVPMQGSASRWKQYLATHPPLAYQDQSTEDDASDDTAEQLDRLESKIDDLQDSVDKLQSDN